MQQSTLASTPDTTPLEQPATAPSRAAPRLRLDMLDGMRGLAALYVALFHAMGYTGRLTTIETQASAPARFIAKLLNYGPYAVPVFIVLSGFCLMLPLAQRGVTTIPGGALNYIRRRAWRILPSYYVALILSLILIALVPILQTPLNTSWDTKIPVTTGTIISHVLLVHNFLPEWIYKIDGPMWSVATEWQIYFLFPALLLPLLRRSSIAVTVGVALVLGVLPHFILPSALNIDIVHPWFLGLFTMGMAGAMIVFSDNPAVAAYRAKIQRGWVNLALTLLVFGALAANQTWMDYHPYISEPLVGIMVMGWLIQCASTSRSGARRSFFHRMLETRALVGLGAFSYSIYLVHNPIQALINLETLDMPISADVRLALMILVATPISVLCGYVFYILFERRFTHMKGRVTAATPASATPITSNAPHH